MKATRLARSFIASVKWRVTLALGVTLIIVVTAAAAINSRRVEPVDSGISIYLGTHLAANIEGEALSYLPANFVHIDGEEYTAAAMHAVLAYAGAVPTEGERAVFMGEGSMVFSGKELLEDGGLYIAYMVGGEELSEENGGPYALLIPREDGNAARLDNLREIRIQLQE